MRHGAVAVSRFLSGRGPVFCPFAPPPWISVCHGVADRGVSPWTASFITWPLYRPDGACGFLNRKPKRLRISRGQLGTGYGRPCQYVAHGTSLQCSTSAAWALMIGGRAFGDLQDFRALIEIRSTSSTGLGLRSHGQKPFWITSEVHRRRKWPAPPPAQERHVRI